MSNNPPNFGVPPPMPSPWVDPKTGIPTIPFYQFQQSLYNAEQSFLQLQALVMTGRGGTSWP